jgi:hypothetical protein
LDTTPTNGKLFTTPTNGKLFTTNGKLLKTNGKILFDKLGIEGNPRCKNFIELWFSKHTPEQSKYLLGDS